MHYRGLSADGAGRSAGKFTTSQPIGSMFHTLALSYPGHRYIVHHTGHVIGILQIFELLLHHQTSVLNPLEVLF